jgi:hypothetical protein
MKYLSLILFILGLFWAYACLSLVMGPLILFASGPHFSSTLAITLEYLASGIFVILGLVGYWIWWGWLIRFRTGIFPRNYLNISLVHHGLWLLIFPLIFAPQMNIHFTINIIKTWSVVMHELLTGSAFFPLGQIVLGWIFLNLAICAACRMRNREELTKLS